MREFQKQKDNFEKHKLYLTSSPLFFLCSFSFISDLWCISFGLDYLELIHFFGIFGPCFGCPKSGECDQMRYVSKNKWSLKMCIFHNFRNRASLRKSLFLIVSGKKWFPWASSISKILDETLFKHRKYAFFGGKEGKLRSPVTRP